MFYEAQLMMPTLFVSACRPGEKYPVMIAIKHYINIGSIAIWWIFYRTRCERFDIFRALAPGRVWNSSSRRELNSLLTGSIIVRGKAHNRFRLGRVPSPPRTCSSLRNAVAEMIDDTGTVGHFFNALGLSISKMAPDRGSGGISEVAGKAITF